IGLAEKVVRDNGFQPGDRIIVTGTLGDHGLAVLTSREGFEFGEQILSDVAPVWEMVELALAAGEVHAMKDPTRGGFASAINDMARKSRTGVVIEEETLPIRRSVRSASEMLGIDPLEVANEGKIVMAVAPGDAEPVLAALRTHRYGKEAAIVGTVVEGDRVIMRTRIGGERFIEPPLGDPVPRVC
ncbi:MAG TPA: AIR synthase-related protein, partial [Methanomicrobiales archaeon]|nr:AIR synthase-related protein [Methanomicrobiales archaeon]